MKQIKFRGVTRANNNYFAFGSYVKCDGQEYIIENGRLYGDNGELIFASWHEIEPDTVAQFTGVKDKYDREIYTGNLLNHKRHAESGNWASERVFDKDYEVKVGFENGMFIADASPNDPLSVYIKDHTYGGGKTDWEIVGNIYET